jgi:predicted PurR-regulated permease PerM
MDKANGESNESTSSQAGGGPQEDAAASQAAPVASPNPHLWQIAWVRDLLVIAAVVVLLLLAQQLRNIVDPILLGLLLAYLFNPLIAWFEIRWKWPRPVAASLLIAAVVLAVVGAGLLVAPLAISQAVELAEQVPQYIDQLATRAGFTDEVLRDQIRGKLNDLKQDPMSVLPYVWHGASRGVGFVSDALSGLTSIGLTLGLTPLCFVLFAWSWPRLVAWPGKYIPASRRDHVFAVLGKMDQAVGGYFRVRVFIALIMACMYTAGWGVVGVPYWFLLGLLAGLLGLIPYAAALAWLLAMFLKFLELESGITGISDALAVFVWPSLIYFLVQMSDDWLLTPWLQGRELELSLLAIIFAVFAGGALAGLLGMLLAVPIAACVKILWQEVIGASLEQFAKEN